MDYYPEQWDISMIDEDMDNIVEIGCNVIRIAEFAWHIMEKTEGSMTFRSSIMSSARQRRRGFM